MKHLAFPTMAAVLCAACAPLTIKTSDVTPAGDGTFLVVGKPSDNTDWGDIRIATLKAANEYCAKQNKSMQQVHSETHGTSGWGEQSLELTFRCAS